MIELLIDPAYGHMLFNHVPIIGLVMAFVVLVTGTVIRHASMIYTGLVLITLTAGSSYPVAMLGDNAYPVIFDHLDGQGRAWLDYHVYIADTWLPVLYMNTIIAAFALGLGRLRRAWLRTAGIAVALVTLAGIATAGWIASAGGNIKHPEFRLDDPPAYESSGRLG